jgi:hypothetical protein
MWEAGAFLEKPIAGNRNFQLTRPFTTNRGISGTDATAMMSKKIDGGLYFWHPNYWGYHVGFYGGVNYGFGHFGVGYSGGHWHNGVMAYNRGEPRRRHPHTQYVQKDRNQ